MGYCWVSDCMNEANQRCSGCKTATYCGDACQKEHWKEHKMGCKMQRMIYDMEQKNAEKEKAKGPPPKPRTTHCTGCNGKFKEDYLEVDQECPDCGYITCESCSCSNNRGSCYCDDSNFGHPYCSQEPRHYHRGKKGYAGDYHPSADGGYELNKEDTPEAFESKARPCNRCGEVVFCLKKEYRNMY